MESPVKYPVGQQSFQQLREGGYLYVDKTRFIEKIVNGPQYYFLGRPRRFGKSLFLSTLKAFFEGRRDLFRGLSVDSMKWDWVPYPVFYLDLNNQKYKEDDNLDILMNGFLSGLEEKYGVENSQIPDCSERFARLIRNVALKTGRGVVLIFLEYDTPHDKNKNDPEPF